MRPRTLLPVVLLAACSDYQFTKDSGVQGAQAPHIVADPDAVSTILCGGETVAVELGNEGPGMLEISAVTVQGDGWSLATPFDPCQIPSGETRDVSLTPSVGSAILHVESNDPDEPDLKVPLEGSQDEAPGVTITAPVMAEILPVDNPYVLEGQARDDVDPPDLLLATWTSDLLGVLFTGPVQRDGTVSYAWDAATRMEGPQTITLSVTDTCGNLATDAVPICQQAGWTADELDISAWHFEGAATWDAVNGYLVLTEPLTYAVGTAFNTANPVTGDAVNIRFLFYIGGGTGADGLSLTVLDTTRTSVYLGGTGCGLGYGGDASCTSGPALPGWSIEVDTYYNDGQDPTPDDHLMFTFDGDVDDPALWVALPEMEDTGWHTMEVDAAAPHVRVVIDGITYIDEDLSGNFAFPALVGFTAGTGSLTNYHLIDALTVTQYACE